MLEFMAVSALLELTPGPNMGYLAVVAIGHGARRAMAAVAGVALGLALVGALAALGATALMEAWPASRDVLRWGGVAYMLWLAFDTWRGAADGVGDGPDMFASFRRGFIANLLNPKAAAFFVTVLPSFIRPDGDILRQNLVLVVIYVAVATLIHSGIVALAAGLGRTLKDGAGEKLLRRGLALALVAVSAWMAWATRG